MKIESGAQCQDVWLYVYMRACAHVACYKIRTKTSIDQWLNRIFCPNLKSLHVIDIRAMSMSSVTVDAQFVYNAKGVIGQRLPSGHWQTHHYIEKDASFTVKLEYNSVSWIYMRWSQD